MTGCCDSCNGTGKAMDASTNGLCWDCRGTGHPHDRECKPPYTMDYILANQEEFAKRFENWDGWIPDPPPYRDYGGVTPTRSYPNDPIPIPPLDNPPGD